MDIILTVDTLFLPTVLRGVNLDMALWGKEWELIAALWTLSLCIRE